MDVLALAWPMALPLLGSQKPAASLEARSMTQIYTSHGETFHGHTVEEPYQLALNFLGRLGGWYCAGSIIAVQWVLTAAHCTNSSLSVEVERFQPRLLFMVPRQNYRQHPDFNEHLNNDIALIKVPALLFSGQLKAVPLPWPAELSQPQPDHMPTHAWCYEWPHDPGTPPFQRRVISNANCRLAGYAAEVIIDSTLCAVPLPGESGCVMDAGGALLLQPHGVLAGVVSFGSDADCFAGAPIGHARITSFLHWLFQEMNSVDAEA